MAFLRSCDRIVSLYKQVVLELVRGRTFACDEGDELAHAFLHALLCLLRNFGILWECCLHDTSNWSKVSYVSIRGILFPRFGNARRLWGMRRRIVGHDRTCDRRDTTKGKAFAQRAQ